MVTVLTTLCACQPLPLEMSFEASSRIWTLVEIDGEPFRATATLRFGKGNRINGRAPCNRYFAKQSGTYPSFSIGPVGITRRACPDLASEAKFLHAIERADTAAIEEGLLVLTGPEGLKLVFKLTG